ncbi:UNVERIFIED_CONTAM: hypothetical protein RMT77_000169 [Armadillidium vulgare]
MTSRNIKSYELITDELVKETLEKDKGKKAELLSWEIRDFTKKGDNFASTVTSVLVKYKENNICCEESYVAKLNPLRPQSTFTEIMEDLYSRETVILSSIIEGMNKHLGKLGLPFLKTPKMFARNLERGREAFIAENLRNQGFIMPDRKKCLNINHANLVMEELGRFHASSILFEEKLYPKTIPDTFDYFEEPFFDFNHKSFKLFNAMLNSQAEAAIKFLIPIPKYEVCTKWLKSNSHCMGRYFVEGFTPHNQFDVLVHGDCCSNNLLFRYDKKDDPVDVIFVDLQSCRKSSPASDLIYFFYSSLDGDVRSKYFKQMTSIYYKSFPKVLHLAKKKIPFSFTELLEEIDKRKTFGLATGIFLLPAFLAEDDEIFDMENFSDDKLEEILKLFQKNFEIISEREGPFKDRFLSIFDDMLESGIFERF